MQPSNHQRRHEISALTWSLRPFPAGILAPDPCFRPSRPGLVLRQRMSDSVQTVDATKSDKSVGKTSVYQKPDVGSEFWTHPKGKSGPRTLNVWLKSEQKNPRRWSRTPVVEPDSAGSAGGRSSRWKSGPFQRAVASGWNFLSWANHSVYSDWFFMHWEPVEPVNRARMEEPGQVFVVPSADCCFPQTGGSVLQTLFPPFLNRCWTVVLTACPLMQHSCFRTVSTDANFPPN